MVYHLNAIVFEDRIDAGRKLANLLLFYKKSPEVVVIAIPRGGVVVAKVLSDALNLPLKCLVTKKLGAPENKELAIGAVGPGKIKYLDEKLIRNLGIDKKYLTCELKKKFQEIKKRELELGVYNYSQKDKRNTVILVDDGIATGATVFAAIKYIKEVSGVRGQGSGIEKGKILKPETYNLKLKIILAVPVVAKDSFEKISKIVHRLVSVEVKDDFQAVGQYYRAFGQISDTDVINILRSSNI